SIHWFAFSNNDFWHQFTSIPKNSPIPTVGKANLLRPSTPRQMASRKAFQDTQQGNSTGDYADRADRTASKARRLRFSAIPNPEDFRVEGHPVWTMISLSILCGNWLWVRCSGW